MQHLKMPVNGLGYILEDKSCQLQNPIIDNHLLWCCFAFIYNLFKVLEVKNHNQLSTNKGNF